MNNYPPGVTGNEPEIAGYDEVEIDFSCTNEEFSYDAEADEDIPCGFDGKAGAALTYKDRYEAVFAVICPRCGVETEVIWENEN